MTFLELKERLKALLFGDSVFKDDAKELKTITYSAMIDIATRVVPFCLISSDLRKDEPLRYLSQQEFIKYPKKILNDETIIELDTALHTALCLKIASMISSVDKRMYYEKSYRIELDRFTFSNFKVENESRN